MIGTGGGHNVGEYADALMDDVNGVFNAGTNVTLAAKAAGIDLPDAAIDLSE